MTRCRRAATVNFPPLARLAMVLLVLAPVWDSAALPLSGMAASEIDDNADLGSFLEYLEKGEALPHEALDIGGRSIIRIVDESGRPLPFVTYRIFAGAAEHSRGISNSDGAFPYYPAAGPEADVLRIELSGRGAARVAIMPAPGQAGETRIELGAARPVPEPVACDLVFVVDSTVSMATRFASMKAALGAAVGMIAKSPLRPELRVGLVLYRDRGDEYLVRETSLTSDLAAFESALAGAEARGGGDIPEDLGAGITAAIEDMDYAHDAARIVFAITDAPPKGPGDATGGSGAGYAVACRAAVERGIKVCTVAVGKMAPEGEYALRQIAGYTRATYIAADLGSAPRIASAAKLVRGDLESLIARIVIGEAEAARGGGGRGTGARDPALDLLDSVQARMASAMTYPETARLRGVSGTVRIALRVGADGLLLGRRIAESSGSAVLDRAALELAASAFPSPNPAGSDVELEIAVVYRLER
ncbi:MAG: TonB family protein [Spirochaetes bacterium]|nr:TonB family protein [Spirochaetota bacterium]